MQMSSTFITASFIFDMLCIILLIGLALYHAHKGLAATVVQLCGTVASAVGAYWAANQIAPWVFNTFVRDHFTQQITESVANADVNGLGEYAEQLIGFLPKEISAPIITAFTQDLSENIAGNATMMAQVIVNDVLEPMFVPFILVLSFFVVFTILRIIVSLLVRMLEGVNAIPVLGNVNQMLGFVIGLLAGAIDVYLVLCAVWGLMIIANGEIPFLTMETLSDSYFLKIFEQFNPFM